MNSLYSAILAVVLSPWASGQTPTAPAAPVPEVLPGGTTGTDQASGVGPLITKLAQSSSGLLERRNAIVALGKAADSAPLAEDDRAKAVSLLVENLSSDKDVVVRSQSAWALGKIKEPAAIAVPALINALDDTDWTVRHNSTLALQWIGKPALPALEKAAGGDDKPITAAHALLIVATMDDSSPERYLDAAIENLDHELLLVRQLALQTLGGMGSKAKTATPKIAALLDHQDTGLRKSAIEALGTLGPDAASATPRLIQSLKTDEERWNRIAAAIALADVGRDHPDTPAALASAFTDKKKRVRAYAADSLGKLGEAALPAITKEMQTDNALRRRHAIMAAETMGAAAKPLVGMLVKAVEHDQPPAQIAAASCIGSIGFLTPEQRDILVALAAKEDKMSSLRAHIELSLKRVDEASQANTSQ